MYEILKDFNQFKVGEKTNFKDKIAKELIAEGYIAKQLEKEVKVRTKELKLKKENDKDDSK
jgi:hypothetical protein